MNKSGSLRIIGSTIVGGLVGLWLTMVAITPYDIPNQFKRASETYDRSKLEQLINYDSVSASLADTMLQNMSPEMRGSDNAFTKDLVDTMINPRAVMALFNGGSMEPIGLSSNAFDLKNVDRKYVGLNSFVYTVKTKPVNGTSQTFYITADRYGAFGTRWKVNRITFVFNTVDAPAVAQESSRAQPSVDPNVSTSPLRFITGSGNIVCERGSLSISCVNSSQEGFYCDTNSCQYDEVGVVQFNGSPVTPYVGDTQISNIKCTTNASSVSCYVGNSTSMITSEYVEVIGDIDGARS